jgi:hypothetical protein
VRNTLNVLLKFEQDIETAGAELPACCAAHASRRPAHAMQSSLLRFVEILRSHQLPVSPAETLDAAAAMDAVGYADRRRCATPSP